MATNLPRPPASYGTLWANQYTRVIEQQFDTLQGQIQNLIITTDRRVFSVIFYGADPTGVTDSTAAFNKAYQAADAAGGGVILVPRGTYKVSGEVIVTPNTELLLEGATLTGLRSSGGHTFLAQGVVGAEIPLTVQAVRGDTQLTITSTATLAVGDYIYPNSTMRTLTTDAPSNWQLGDTDTPTTSPFFADPPIRILSIDSGTTLTLESPLIFPTYALTGAGSRSVSTIQKVDFVDGVKIAGWGTAEGGGTTVFRFEWCMRPDFGPGIAFEMGANPGASIRMENCYMPSVEAYPGTRHEGLLDDAGFLADHSDYNSYLDVGSWFSSWTTYDRNGSQGLDVTYTGSGNPSVQPYIRGVSIDSAYDGMTFHEGCYGGIVDGFRAERPARAGIRNRSRGVTIIGAQITGPNQITAGGITTIGWGMVDAIISGGVIDGFPYGIQHDPSTVAAVGPAVLNARIEGLSILRATRGIWIQDRPAGSESTVDSRISIAGINCDNMVDYGVRIGDYWNYTSISDIRGGDFSGGSAFVVYNGNNAIGTKIFNISGALESTTGLVRTGNITDTTRFPAATYTTNRVQVNLPSLEVTGSGFRATLGGDTFRTFSSGITLALFDAFSTLRVGGSGGINITVPLNSSVAFSLGTWIDVINGSSGNVTIVATGGVTINNSNTLVLQTLQRGYLYKSGTDTWFFFAQPAITIAGGFALTATLGANSNVTFPSGNSSMNALNIEGQALTGGWIVTAKALGTVTTGTITPDPGARPIQTYTNGGAHTLAPSANVGNCLVDITNNGSAGAITTGSWTKVVGTAFDTTNGHTFRCSISITANGSLLSVQGLF